MAINSPKVRLSLEKNNKLDYMALFSSALILIICLFFLENSKTSEKKEYYAQMLSASTKAQAAFDAIKKERLTRGYAIDPILDINETGLIGLDFSEITTTFGSIESKRSTTNPDCAAMIVEMLYDIGLKEGDSVALNLSGSFPALNICAIVACETLGITPRIINSVGSSTFGANIADFTWPDMENHLYTNELIENRSVWVSFGGQNDIGQEFDNETAENIYTRLNSLGYRFFGARNVNESISMRVYFYGDVDAFINVGGNIASFGENNTMDTSKGGIISELPKNEKGTGLIQHYLAEAVPVIHLLNMKDLLPAYNIDFDPSPIPKPGESRIYFTNETSIGTKIIAIGGIIISTFICVKLLGKESSRL